MPQGTDPSMTKLFADLGGGDHARQVAADRAASAEIVARNTARINAERDAKIASAQAEAKAALANKP
jgi:hypothetical protein